MLGVVQTCKKTTAPVNELTVLVYKSKRMKQILERLICNLFISFALCTCNLHFIKLSNFGVWPYFNFILFILALWMYLPSLGQTGTYLPVVCLHACPPTFWIVCEAVSVIYEREVTLLSFPWLYVKGVIYHKRDFDMGLAHRITHEDSVRGAEFATGVPRCASQPSAGEACQNRIKISQVNNFTGLLLFMGSLTL